MIKITRDKNQSTVQIGRGVTTIRGFKILNSPLSPGKPLCLEEFTKTQLESICEELFDDGSDFTIMENNSNFVIFKMPQTLLSSNLSFPQMCKKILRRTTCYAGIESMCFFEPNCIKLNKKQQ